MSRAMSITNTASASLPTKPPEVNKKMVLVVAAALINKDGQVLLAQRPEGKAMAGLWEFPGGKIESGETPEQALSRELQEELQVEVAGSDLVPITFASHSYESFHLLMPTFACYKWEGEPMPAEGQTLAWVAADELTSYEMPAADIPLIEPISAAMAKARTSMPSSE